MPRIFAQKNRQAGFTLLELLIVIGVLSLVAAIAASSIISFLPNYRLKVATRDLMTNLQQARSEAIKRNQPCTVSFADQTIDGIPYNYVIWFDTNDNKTFDNGEIKISAVNWDDYPGVKLDASLGDGDGLSFLGDSFTFNSRGLCDIQVEGVGNTIAKISLINEKKQKRSVSISLTGAVQANDINN